MLCGSVLSVWTKVEGVLASVSGTNVKMQIVRLRTEDGQRIVGESDLLSWSLLIVPGESLTWDAENGNKSSLSQAIGRVAFLACSRSQSPALLDMWFSPPKLPSAQMN